MENVEKEEGCFVGQVEEIMRSKNFVEICDITVEKREYGPLDGFEKFNVSFVVREQLENKKLEDNLEKFREGIGICAEWPGKTYGVHSAQGK